MLKYFCWVDETIWPGPYQEDVIPLDQIWGNMIKSFDGLIEPMLILSRQYEKLILSRRYEKIFEAAGAIEHKDFVYSNSVPSPKWEYLEQDRKANLPKGTTEKIFKEFGNISDCEIKRQIGRGNVAGKGPRSNTLFRRSGHKSY